MSELDLHQSHSARCEARPANPLLDQLKAVRRHLANRTAINNKIDAWRDDLQDRIWRQELIFELLDSDADGADIAAEVAAFKRIVRALAWGRAA